MVLLRSVPFTIVRAAQLGPFSIVHVAQLGPPHTCARPHPMRLPFPSGLWTCLCSQTIPPNPRIHTPCAFGFHRDHRRPFALRRSPPNACIHHPMHLRFPSGSQTPLFSQRIPPNVQHHMSTPYAPPFSIRIADPPCSWTM